MKNFKTILGIALFVGIAYSCEPEELPIDTPAPIANGENTNPSDDGDSGNVDGGEDDDGDFDGGR